MSVYVDDAFIEFGRMDMCHMVADTHDELVAMADIIGVSRRWIQKVGTPKEHFDVCRAKRALAIRAGAIEADGRALIAIFRRKQADGRTESEA